MSLLRNISSGRLHSNKIIQDKKKYSGANTTPNLRLDFAYHYKILFQNLFNFCVLHHCRSNTVWIPWNKGNGIKRKLFNIILGYLFLKLSSLSTLSLHHVNVHLQIQALYKFWLEEKSHSVLRGGKTLKKRDQPLHKIRLSISIIEAKFYKTYPKQDFISEDIREGRLNFLWTVWI